MSNREIKIKAKAYMKEHLGFSIIVLLLAAGVNVICGTVGMGIGTLLVSGLVSVFICNYFISVVNDNPIKDFSKLIEKTDRFSNSILVNLILTAIYFGLSLIPLIIFLVLVWPTIMNSNSYEDVLFALFTEISIISLIIAIITLFAQVRFKFVFHILSETNKLESSVDYIKESMRITKGKFWRIIKFELSFIGWYLLVIVTFGIALIYFAPYYQTCVSILYKEICLDAGVNYQEEVEIIG